MSVIHGKKTSIQDVQVFAIKLGGKLLSVNYINMLSPLDWECTFGHKFTTTFNHVKNRNQWCPICGKEKAVKTIRKRFAEDTSIRERISKSHLKRLSRQSCFSGKSQREIASRLRDHLTGLFRNPHKHKSILKYLGCSIEELKKHLESKFQEGMTWDNRGFYGWHIDHIKPLSSFDLSIEENRHKAFNYLNLQPLWAKDNLVKSYKFKEK